MYRVIRILPSVVLFGMFTITLLQGSPVAIPESTKQQVLQAYGKLPLSFEANEGQTASQVKFLSRGAGYTLFLTADEAVLALQRAKAKSKIKNQKARIRSRQVSVVSGQLQESAGQTGHTVLRMKLVGANPAPQVSGLGELPGKSNYFIGNDPKKWSTNVRNYAKVRYQDVYPGVDLIYYGNQRQLEYDFVVAPGADPNAIKLNFRGAEEIRLNEKGGDLVLSVGEGQVRFRKPRVYQLTTSDKRARTTDAIGGKHYIDGEYVLRGNGGVGFQVGPYDASRALVVDPVLSYSTYLGGNNADDGVGIAVDASGNSYVTGDTSSVNFPTTSGAFQTTCGGCPAAESNAFVTKLDPTGSTLIFSTYLGGAGSDEGLAIAVDSSGSAYVTGDTFSTDFPTTLGAFQPTLTPGTCGVPPNTFPCPDAFVTKLNPTGSSLVYSTYLGGSQAEFGLGIAVDSSGRAYVTGSTSSVDFPTTPGAFQITFGGGTCFGKPCPDAFVTALDPTGSTEVYSTYLGGSNEDEALGIALDASNNAYVTGNTLSMDFPTTPGAFQITFGGGTCGIPPDTSPCPDAFVTKFDPTGAVEIYSTYLGGNNDDGGAGIALDGSGNAYVTGSTSSANFPTTSGAFQTTLGGGTCGIPPDTFPCPDAFVTKLNSAGSVLAYSTYLGGNNNDQGNGIAVDVSGSAYVTGLTSSSTNFPLMNPIQVTFGGGPADAFVAKIDPSQPGPAGLVFSTYLGGSNNDQGAGIALDSSGNTYVVGNTNSNNFPTTLGAFQTIFGGGTCGPLAAPCPDAFVVRISP